MLRILAHVISSVFHPLLMPTIIFGLLLFGFDTFKYSNPEAEYYMLAAIFLMTAAIPSIMILMMNRLGVIKDLHLDQKSERTVPFLFTAVIYMLSCYFFNQIHLDARVIIIILIMAGCILSVTLINLFWKISAHAVAIAGAIGVVLRLNYKVHDPVNVYILAALVTIGGLVLTSRLLLNAHKPEQVYTGFTLGLSVSTVSAVILL